MLLIINVNFLQDNFITFLNGCKELGLSDWQLFSFKDIQECENLNQRR